MALADQPGALENGTAFVATVVDRWDLQAMPVPGNLFDVSSITRSTLRQHVPLAEGFGGLWYFANTVTTFGTPDGLQNGSLWNIGSVFNWSTTLQHPDLRPGSIVDTYKLRNGRVTVHIHNLGVRYTPDIWIHAQ